MLEECSPGIILQIVNINESLGHVNKLTLPVFANGKEAVYSSMSNRKNLLYIPRSDFMRSTNATD